MRKNIGRFAGLVFALLPLCIVVNVQASSFDCAKAQTKVEKIICADSELSKLDEELNKKYTDILSKNVSPDAIKAKQKLWLKERNRCENISCVKSAYMAKMEELNTIGEIKAFSVQAKPVGEPTSKQDADETCLKPKIDWRNYEWTLIVGNGRTACEEMLAYLKSRPKDGPPPVCPEDRLPPNGHWTRPEWKEVCEAQRQHFLENIPEKKQKYFRRDLKQLKLMTTRTDISGDGIPENLLALMLTPKAYKEILREDFRSYFMPFSAKKWDERCRISTRCASQEGENRGYIRLFGDFSYSLLPLNETGTEIDWQHPAISNGDWLVLSVSGELIHYKKRPYWLTEISWNQKMHDRFKDYAYKPKPSDQWARIFALGPLCYERFDQENLGGDDHCKPTTFENISFITLDESSACYFGYFNRENLRQN